MCLDYVCFFNFGQDYVCFLDLLDLYGHVGFIFWATSLLEFEASVLGSNIIWFVIPMSGWFLATFCFGV